MLRLIKKYFGTIMQICYDYFTQMEHVKSEQKLWPHCCCLGTTFRTKPIYKSEKLLTPASKQMRWSIVFFLLLFAQIRVTECQTLSHSFLTETDKISPSAFQFNVLHGSV